MPSLDIFNNDAFSLASLSRAITDTPFQPTRIGSLGLFSEESINTTSVMIERQGETLSLVPTAPRGSTGKADVNPKRQMVSLSTVHLPAHGAVMADEVLNLRAFGSETELASVQTLVNKKLARMRRNLDVTLEYQRLGALKGKVYDADGTTVLLDLNTVFNLAQQTHDMNLDVTTTKVRNLIVQAKRKVEAALGGLMYTGLVAFVAADFFDALVGHDDVKDAYDRFQNGSQRRDDLRTGFEMAGVKFEEYRGQVSGIDFIESGCGYLVPTGVPDMFVSHYAPGDYVEAAGTNGLKYYSKQEPKPMGKGIDLEAQSNPLMINTRPNAVIKLTA